MPTSRPWQGSVAARTKHNHSSDRRASPATENCAARRLTIAPPVLRQLLRRSRKQVFADQGRHGDGDRLNTAARQRARPTRHFRSAALRPQLRWTFDDPALAIAGLTLVGRIFHQVREGADVPVAVARRRLYPLFLQAPADFLQRRRAPARPSGRSAGPRGPLPESLHNAPGRRLR